MSGSSDTAQLSDDEIQRIITEGENLVSSAESHKKMVSELSDTVNTKKQKLMARIEKIEESIKKNNEEIKMLNEQLVYNKAEIEGKKKQANSLAIHLRNLTREIEDIRNGEIQGLEKEAGDIDQMNKKIDESDPPDPNSKSNPGSSTNPNPNGSQKYYKQKYLAIKQKYLMLKHA